MLGNVGKTLGHVDSFCFGGMPCDVSKKNSNYKVMMGSVEKLIWVLKTCLGMLIDI
jgi:hypothetical protein